VLNKFDKVSASFFVKRKPKAAGDRYDVILTYGGDQKIEVARVVKQILRSGS
jgi:ribosomal protein L7/L12